MAVSKFELGELIKELESHKGKHTELVTVYVPGGYDINSVQRQLEAEKSTAKNIKSTTTRNNVIDALEKIIREMKTFRKTPENGVAFFAGNISQVEGQQDIGFWEIEPPMPLKTRLYRCDKEFVLDPLREMLEVDEVFGLLVMDRKEATIGILEGKLIRVEKKMTSGVPSQIKAGGQCLSPDTLIMKDNGEIVEIKDSHNPLIILSQNFNKEETEETPIIAKWDNEKELFKIITCYPRLEIKSSKEHTFFIKSKGGLEEKPLSQIKKGDYLIMPEKINLNLEDQKISFLPKIKRESNFKEVKIPEKIDYSFAKVLGYYLGDGNYEENRLNFSEQKKEVVEYYQSLIKKIFKLEPRINFRKSKNYWQIRVYSRIISQLFKQIFQEDNKTLNEKIPSLILKSSDSSLAGFISGFFDAEGYVSKGRVAFGINNGIIAKQIQFALLRLGIISSVSEYDNRKNPYSKKTRYTLAIDDLESLKLFREKINFCSTEKRKKVEALISSRSTRNKVRQIVVTGSQIAKIIRNSGLNTRDFRCGDFFCDKKQMSKEIFKKRILENIKDEELRKRLELFYNSNLIAVKISNIESLGISKTIDIETKNHNFIANGLVVHNSSQRFHRILEGLTKDFYKRIAEEMKNIFYEMKKLKGIIVGGPVPTKDEFLDGEYMMTRLREKVIGRIDTGDTSESGLKELVEKANELLAQQEITKEKKEVQSFFEALAKTPDRSSIDLEHIKKSLEMGAVEKLFVSEKIDRKILHELQQMAENTGAEIRLISTETEEGIQFYNLRGVGAILRYKVH